MCCCPRFIQFDDSLLVHADRNATFLSSIRLAQYSVLCLEEGRTPQGVGLHIL